MIDTLSLQSLEIEERLFSCVSEVLGREFTKEEYNLCHWHHTNESVAHLMIGNTYLCTAKYTIDNPKWFSDLN